MGGLGIGGGLGGSMGGVVSIGCEGRDDNEYRQRFRETERGRGRRFRCARPS